MIKPKGRIQIEYYIFTHISLKYLLIALKQSAMIIISTCQRKVIESEIYYLMEMVIFLNIDLPTILMM